MTASHRSNSSRRCAASLICTLRLGNAGSTLNLLSQLRAHGAAVVARGKVSLIGATPTQNEVLVLASWLAKTNQPVFGTDRLSEMYPPATMYKSVASGVLSARLSSRAPDFLIWFRPEHIEVVNWAGDPKKPVKVSETDGELRLQPRSSFALWKESVTGRAEPWKRSEKEAAANLRQAILEVILNRAEEMERVNRQLSAANEELDSFAYVASHDLKEPLRGVHHMASFLKRGQDGELSVESHAAGRDDPEADAAHGRSDRVLVAVLAHRARRTRSGAQQSRLVGRRSAHSVPPAAG